MSCQTLFSQLIHAYGQMDAAFDKISEQYNFRCNGCEDNCCRSLFYHHTLIEKKFLLEGFAQLDPLLQKSIKKKAKIYIEQTFNKDKIESKKIMCPANKSGRCLIYTHRPMICRLHGLPHELALPGHPPVKGPGCKTGGFDKKPYIPFDRTPFYRMMAQAEINFRSQNAFTGKIKETVAHMLLS